MSDSSSASGLDFARSNRHETAFEGSVVIIGFTGLLGSGCTFIAEGVRDSLGHRCRYYKLSSFLREHFGKTKPLVSDLQDLGNKLRREHGRDYLTHLCLKKVSAEDRSVNAQPRQETFTQLKDSVIIIDGIRNDGEVEYLRNYPHFFLVSVHADTVVRWERLSKEKKPRFKSREEFAAADERDQEEFDRSGQRVKYCNDLADIIIGNNETFKEAQKKKRKDFISDLVHKYVNPLVAARDHQTIEDRPPTNDETLMTIAYCASKLSNCRKRKVGAAIALKFDAPDEGIAGPGYRVMSVGFNEVPERLQPCVFWTSQGCFRDSLQGGSAKLIKNCPTCGTKIPSRFACPHCNTSNPVRDRHCAKPSCTGSPIFDYTCPDCNTRVFHSFVPGAKGAHGKLMDMCRALHAEENAIISRPAAFSNGEGLVLYTTTFPCNLCANKIVAAGIKEVVYAEPYNMVEAEEILRNGGVAVRRFTGIKSTAYFRLYA